MTEATSLSASLRACSSALDALLHLEILRLRARYQLALDEFRGLYVSDEQVDALARELRNGVPATPLDGDGDHRSLCQQLDSATARHEPLAVMAARLELAPLERALLFLAAAPGIDPRYETLYAYLNNDVTRKLLSVDLAVRLLGFSPEVVLSVRAALAPGASLTASRVLSVQAGRDTAPSAAQQRMVAGHPGVPDALLGLPFQDAVLPGLIELLGPRASGDALAHAIAAPSSAHRIERALAGTPRRVIVLEGNPWLSPQAFLRAWCAQSNRSLAILDLRRVQRDSLAETLGRAALFSCVRGAALLVAGVDALYAEGRSVGEPAALRVLLEGARVPVFLAAPSQGTFALPFEPSEFVTLTREDLPSSTRRVLWLEALAREGLQASEPSVDALSRRFRIGPDLIDAAARRIADETPLGGCSSVPPEQLFAAARAQTDSGLGRVAQRVPQRHAWGDLVLPGPTRARIAALIQALRSRERVLEGWGMGRSLGTLGLRILFAGPSGTGKTMTASIVARELGLDAYRIDLAQTVSKYIGETEKNLERMFQAAEHANAILFLDEADALLGKRSEVRDAHDRYANIEIAYLLQRLEQFDGIVIVATNISRNIDAAFARRMQFVIEFPLPDSGERELLWRSSFPATAPLAADVDFEFLSRRFELTGGDIRNVALDAAFIAAGREDRISMRHIAQALARELMKQGRSPSAADFKQHYALLDAEPA